MNYTEFKSTLKEQIKGKYGIEVVEKNVEKNGITCEAFVLDFFNENENVSISPTIYPRLWYDNDVSINKAMELIDNAKNNTPQINTNEIVSEKYLMENTVFDLVSKSNPKYLEGKVYKDYLDMALVCRCVISNDADGRAGFVVKEDILKNVGINKDEFLQAVERNTMNIKHKYIDFMGMTVVSNESSVYGAVVMTNPEVRKEIEEKVNGEYYIIPSSVHEIIIMPKDLAPDVSNLFEMVKEVNDTQVSAEDRLSYSVYDYNGQTNELTIADSQKDLVIEDIEKE